MSTAINKTNYWEDVIDQMMIDEVSGLDADIKATLEGLDQAEQRLAILSILDKNRGLYMNIHNIVSKNSVSKTEHIKELLKMLREYVKVGEIEKKLFGEVMTPISLVEEMLSHLPEGVWKNKDLKFLDPCNGVGIFSSVIVSKLMEGLSDSIPNEEERYKHIMENMLYVCELQPKNMFLYLCGFDPDDEFLLNIHCGSFLDKGFDNKMKEWGIEKFDIIVGNPPYNAGQNAEGKRGGGDSLWDDFVRKALNSMIRDNGYLVYVHPSAWRKPPSERSKTNDLLHLMTNENQMLYLEIHNSQDGMKTFGAATRYDFYLIKRCEKFTNTTVVDEIGKIHSINCSEWKFIPNFNFETILPLLGSGCEIIFNVSNYETRKIWVSSEQTEEFCYPLVHSTPKSGTRYMYSSRNDNGHFGIPKVIFGETGIADVIIDMKGNYGMTQQAMAIRVESIADANSIKNALMSKAFSEILTACSWSNYRIDWRMFMYFHKDFWKRFT